MASPDFPEPPAAIPPTPLADVDSSVARLVSNVTKWVETDIPTRIRLLEESMATTDQAAEAWIQAACQAKGIDPDSPVAGEEWLAGPMTVIRNLRLLRDALKADGQPKVPSWRTAPTGQKVAEIFPAEAWDKLFYGGVSAEVWIEPGKEASQGEIYRQKARGEKGEGGVGLVLGAGNVASIGPMDALYKLYVDDEVVIIKTNPVNAYLGPHWEQSLKPFIDYGVLEVVHGGAEVGAHLTYDDNIASVHITGSNFTHDAIVWGADAEERERRMANDEPKLTKPISSELGAVTPCFVIPGDWSDKDIDYQARAVASMVANNGSFNCNAAKSLVVASGWAQKDQFLERVRHQLARTHVRKAYYPGAQDRYRRFLDNYPQAKPLTDGNSEIVPWTVIPDVSPSGDEYALSNEAFCGVLAEVELEADDAASFIREMVRFGNEEAWGTLSCMMLVHPDTEKAHKAQLEQALADLEYGSIGVNCWAALSYALVVTTWGAFPGHSLKDIQSGRGVVHNTFLLDHPQKSIVRSPFRMFPTPPWFADNKNTHNIAKRITRFEANPSWLKVPGIIAAALKG